MKEGTTIWIGDATGPAIVAMPTKTLAPEPVAH
jgi:hypothetical protein